jgi:hypothetical protein
MKRIAVALLIAVVPALVGSRVFAEEGKWTPQQVRQLPDAELRKLGLEIPSDTLWDTERGGLLEAVVKISGCTAGFVSREGLLLTNHHCAFSALQEHSLPQNDIIENGFLAKTRAEELRAAGQRAAVPHRFSDVTDAVVGAVPGDADDLQRYEAIDRKQKQLVAECEKTPFRRCKVAAFDGGVSYVLVESIEFPDLRLVYAPPRSVGEYGGEVDNWSWPRHTGDFALLRVYAGPDNQPAPPGEDNTPYRPRRHLQVATGGVESGGFVMLAGYPGRTYRSLTTAEMAERVNLYFPKRAELYQGWLRVMEAASRADARARIQLASRIKSLANREKNARGQIAGIERGRLLEKKRAQEDAVLTWAADHPEQQPAVAAYRELHALVRAKVVTWDRDFLLGQISAGPKPLGMAMSLVRWARERAKPDAERHPDYMERNRERAGERLRRDQKSLHQRADEALLADLLVRLASLPEDASVPSVRSFIGDDWTWGTVSAQAAELLQGTRVTDLDTRMAMFDESTEQLRARKDPLLDLAFDLDEEIQGREERDHRWEGAVARLRPQWRRAVMAHAGRLVDPDANGTLRVSFAHVQGYHPQDAIWFEPQTTLRGAAEKHTGEEPFDLAARVREAAGAAPRSRWADPELRDVPVAFLATADTTGGNSGSPVLNGRGELVGVNFDRVWENVANDFGYNPEIARNISVDVRFLLWMLDAVSGEAAQPLLDELGVK